MSESPATRVQLYQLLLSTFLPLLLLFLLLSLPSRRYLRFSDRSVVLMSRWMSTMHCRRRLRSLPLALPLVPRYVSAPRRRLRECRRSTSQVLPLALVLVLVLSFPPQVSPRRLLLSTPPMNFCWRFGRFAIPCKRPRPISIPVLRPFWPRHSAP